MYDEIWRRLPGRFWAKLAQALVLLAAAVALLFLVVFPYAEPRLPWNRSVVTAPSAPASPAPPVPSAGSSP
jgi:hypothetical protein